MSSIQQVIARPVIVSQREEFTLETETLRSGKIIYKLKSGDIKFHNGGKEMSYNAVSGSNKVPCSISGTPGQVQIYAYFDDEVGDEKSCRVRLKNS
jgi:hypothetical protein